MRKNLKRKAGFTIVELLLSVAISVLVFSAMGVLLVKTLRMWGDGAGRWRLANQARAARARLLSGGLGSGTGLLSIREIKSIQTNPNWCTIEYQTAVLDEKFWIQGCVDSTAPADKSIYIKGSKGDGQSWLMMVGVKQGEHDIPDVTATSCNITYANKIVSMSYILSYEAGGVTYEYPQLIQAYLVNE